MIALVRQGLVEYTATTGGLSSVTTFAGDIVGSVLGFVGDNFMMVLVALVTAVLVLGFTSARVR